MKWRALLKNQWFQLCLLVAMLSGAATIYNAVKSTPSSGTASRPSPTPPSIHKIRPKKPGQWILDASGARDSDGKDIQVVAANLTDDDLVTVRPGTYTGNCEIAASARLVGPASDSGVATIRSVDPKHTGMSISGKKVSLENLSIKFEATGDDPAVRIGGDAQVEMTNCSISTQSKVGVFVRENASLTATNCTIDNSHSYGIAISGEAHLKLIKSVISKSGKSGLYSFGENGAAPRSELDHVQFIGGQDDAIIARAGSQLTVQHCQMSDCAKAALHAGDRGTDITVTNTTIKNCKGAALVAQTEATISAAGCIIEENSWGAQAGVRDESGTGGAIALTDCTVRGNTIFGLGACQGGTITMRGGSLGHNGEDTQQETGGEVHVIH